MGERAFARQVAWLPQDPGSATDLAVREVVASGRYPWHGPFGRFTKADGEKVVAALAAVQVAQLADRPLSTLWGASVSAPGLAC